MKIKNPIIMVSIVLLISCGTVQLFGPTVTPSPTKTQTPTITNTPTCTSTRTPTRTPLPSPTPTQTIENPCKYSGSPDAFEPSNILDILTQMDGEIFNQSSQRTETDIYRFELYGGATYGSETRLHYTCQEQIPSPDIRSYCKFERETSIIRVMTGELRDTPERMINKSYVHGRKAWVRPQGGSWNLTATLTNSDVQGIADAFRISPFYFQEKVDCKMEVDYPDLVYVCFEVNLPKFFSVVYGEEITYVDCVVDNQGIVWIDPQTHLPKQLNISFNIAVTFKDQEGGEPYNIVVEMSQKFQAFNEQYTYPNLQ